MVWTVSDHPGGWGHSASIFEVFLSTKTSDAIANTENLDLLKCTGTCACQLINDCDASVGGISRSYGMAAHEVEKLVTACKHHARSIFHLRHEDGMEADTAWHSYKVTCPLEPTPQPLDPTHPAIQCRHV